MNWPPTAARPVGLSAAALDIATGAVIGAICTDGTHSTHDTKDVARLSCWSARQAVGNLRRLGQARENQPRVADTGEHHVALHRPIARDALRHRAGAPGACILGRQPGPRGAGCRHGTAGSGRSRALRHRGAGTDQRRRRPRGLHAARWCGAHAIRLPRRVPCVRRWGLAGPALQPRLGRPGAAAARRRGTARDADCREPCVDDVPGPVARRLRGHQGPCQRRTEGALPAQHGQRRVAGRHGADRAAGGQRPRVLRTRAEPQPTAACASAAARSSSPAANTT